MQGPQLLFLLEEGLQLLDLLVVVLPLRDDPHSSLQFGLLSHGIITLQTQQKHTSVELEERKAHVQTAAGFQQAHVRLSMQDWDVRASLGYTVNALKTKGSKGYRLSRNLSRHRGEVEDKGDTAEINSAGFCMSSDVLGK